MGSWWAALCSLSPFFNLAYLVLVVQKWYNLYHPYIICGSIIGIIKLTSFLPLQLEMIMHALLITLSNCRIGYAVNVPEFVDLWSVTTDKTGCLQNLEKPAMLFLKFQSWKILENEIMDKRSGKAWNFAWPDRKKKKHNLTTFHFSGNQSAKI